MDFLRTLCFAVAIVFVCSIHAKPIRLLRSKRNAYRNSSRLWPKAVVPYTIDEAYSLIEKNVIESAIKDIHAVSCIRFKKYANEKAYVEIVREKGCRAVVGYIGRRQKLTLGHGCIWAARVLHELLHVLGFFHEHTRPDRDDHVILYEENIQPSSLGNFRKMTDSKVTTFGLPYDYSSVLHYHDKEFAIDRSKKTIEPRQGEAAIGRALELSKMDVLKLNKLYRCPKEKFVDEIDFGSGQTELEDNFIVVSMSKS